MLHGLSENKGFCNKDCSANEVCLNNNIDLLQINSKYKCITGYYDSFHKCESLATEKNLLFYYDSDHGHANIVINVINYNFFCIFSFY